MSKIGERLYNGILKENPTLIQTLGMCPTLAVTTSMINGIGMGLSTLMVLVASNILISLLKKFIPETVRIPAYIVVIASLVTIVQFVLQGFVPDLYSSLGIYIPLIVVNCIILGRAESYASKNPVLPSIFDGIGMGLGFTMALAILGFIREIIGNGTILSDGANALVKIPEEIYTPASIAILAPGAFFVLAFVIAVMNKIKRSKGMEPAKVPDYTTDEGCAGCASVGLCRPDIAKKKAQAEAKAAAASAKANAAAKAEKPAGAAAKPAGTAKPAQVTADKTEAVKPEAVKPEAVKPEAAKPETVKAEAVKAAEKAESMAAGSDITDGAGAAVKEPVSEKAEAVKEEIRSEVEEIKGKEDK